MNRLVRFANILYIKYAKYINTQTYSDNNGEYKVNDIINYAIKNCKLVNFKIKDLAKINFMSSPYETGDEVPGSPEFIERAERSDISFPIIVIKYNDGNFIADGVHRLWKARSEGLKNIKGYFMHENDLKNIPKI